MSTPVPDGSQQAGLAGLLQRVAVLYEAFLAHPDDTALQVLNLGDHGTELHRTDCTQARTIARNTAVQPEPHPLSSLRVLWDAHGVCVCVWDVATTAPHLHNVGIVVDWVLTARRLLAELQETGETGHSTFAPVSALRRAALQWYPEHSARHTHLHALVLHAQHQLLEAADQITRTPAYREEIGRAALATLSSFRDPTSSRNRHFTHTDDVYGFPLEQLGWEEAPAATCTEKDAAAAQPYLTDRVWVAAQPAWRGHHALFAYADLAAPTARLSGDRVVLRVPAALALRAGIDEARHLIGRDYGNTADEAVLAARQDCPSGPTGPELLRALHDIAG